MAALLPFALNALRNNKLRTFLSLLGVTIGIFSIIGVLAAVDSLEKEIKGSISSLDNSTIYLIRFSFGPTNIPKWKREQFPDVTFEEYQYIKKTVPDMEAASFVLFVNPETIKYEDESSCILLPLLLRDIENTDYKDAISVYGYAGVLSVSDVVDLDKEKFQD